MDGMARRHPVLISADLEEVFAQHMRSMLPAWHACAIGPELGFGIGRPQINVELLLGPDPDEAEAAVWAQVEEACESSGRSFDPEEWSLLHPPIIVRGS